MYILLPNSPTEPLPSSIDSWARGIVPQQSTSSLHSKISTAEPVHILPSIANMSSTTAEQQGEDVTDSQQEKQRRKSILSETTTSSIGKLKTLKIHPELESYSVYHSLLVELLHVLVLSMHSERSACSVPVPFLQ